MSLTERQKQYISNKSANATAEKIARKLGIDKSEVEAFIKNPTGESSQKQVPFGEGWMFWIVLALMALVPQLFHTEIMDQAVLRLMVMQVAVTGLWTVFLGGRLIVNRSFAVPRGWGIVFSLLVSVWMCLSLLWAVNIYEGAMQLTAYCCGTGLFILLCCLKPSIKQLRMALYVMFFSGVWTALIGLAQDYDYQFLYALDIPQAFPPAATFGNKNLAGHFVGSMLPLGLLALCGARTKKEFLLLPLVLAGVIVDLWFLKAASSAGAIAGILAGAAGCVLVGLISWSMGKSVKLRIAAVIVVLSGLVGVGLVLTLPAYKKAVAQSEKYQSYFTPAFFNSLNNRLSGMMGGFLNNQSLQIRAKMYANTLYMIKEHPLFGVGFGNHRVEYPLYYNKLFPDYEFSQKKQLVNVHSDILQVTSETGVIGLFLVLAFLFSWYVSVIGGFGRLDDFRQKLVICGGLYVVFAYLGISLISFPFQRITPVLLVVSFAGILYSLCRSSSNVTIKPVTFSKIPTAVIALLALAGMVYMVNSAVWWYKKDYYTNNSTKFANNQQWKKYALESEDIYEYAGKRGDPLMNTALSYLFNGRKEKARELTDELMCFHPHYTSALGNAGIIYESLGDLDRAAEVYYHAIEILPQDIDLNRSFFKLLARQNKWAQQADKILTLEQIRDELQKLGQKSKFLAKSGSDVDHGYYAKELDVERQRLIFKLLLANQFYQEIGKTAELSKVLATGLQQNSDWNELRGIYGFTLVNTGQAEQGLQEIAKVYNRLRNSVLSTDSLRCMMMASKYIKDQKQAEKYKKAASSYLDAFLKNCIYEKLGGEMSEINTLKGVLFISNIDAENLGIPHEYLNFFAKPIELVKGSGLKIGSNLGAFTLGEKFYFTSNSGYIVQNSQPSLTQNSGKRTGMRKLFSCNSRDILNWRGAVLLAGSQGVRISLASEVIDKLRKQSSILGTLSLADQQYQYLGVIKNGRLLFEEAEKTKGFDFKLSAANKTLREKLPAKTLTVSVQPHQAVTANVNGKNYSWHEGVRAFFFDNTGRLVKYRTFVPGEGYKEKKPFDLYEFRYQ